MNTLESAIIKHLYIQQTESIADISHAVGRSIPIVTKAVTELLANKMVLASGYAVSTGGRRPILLKLNADALPLVVSIAVDQLFTSVSVYDFSNKAINKPVLVENPLDDSEKASRIIMEVVEQLMASVRHRTVFAIGISMPGFVDSSEGRNNSYDQNDPLFDIKNRIEGAFGIQTFLENDSTAVALAEKHFGQAKDAKDLLVVNLNWGVGLGMIIDNKVFKGYSGYAGEFSHIPLSDTNSLCSCGKRGCLEVDASLRSAIQRAEKRIDAGESSILAEKRNRNGKISGEDILHAVNNGDQLAIVAFQEIAYMLGKGIATLIHIINPEHIIISGRGAKAGNILLPQIHTALMRYAIERLYQSTGISVSTLKNAQLKGSACIAVDRADYSKFETTPELIIKTNTN